MDKGARILNVRHTGAPRSGLFVIGFLAVVMTMTLPSRDAGIIELVFLWCVTFICYGMVLAGLLLDKEKIRFSLYENGIESKWFKWTGNPFISWADINSIKMRKSNVKGAMLPYIYFIPKDPDFYFKKRSRFMRMVYMVEYARYNTAIFFMAQHLDVPADKLLQECQSALENYRAKHGV